MFWRNVFVKRPVRAIEKTPANADLKNSTLKGNIFRIHLTSMIARRLPKLMEIAVDRAAPDIPCMGIRMMLSTIFIRRTKEIFKRTSFGLPDIVRI